MLGMRNIKNVQQYDSLTGELLNGVLVYCGLKCNPYSGGWVMNSQEAFIIISQDKEMTRDALRVFMNICGKLNFENVIQVSQTKIAQEIDIDKYRVSKAIKLLIAKDILLQDSKIGRSFTYRLNPDYGWKGKVKNLNEYRKEIEDQEKLKIKKDYLRSYQNNDIDQ